MSIFNIFKYNNNNNNQSRRKVMRRLFKTREYTHTYVDIYGITRHVYKEVLSMHKIGIAIASVVVVATMFTTATLGAMYMNSGANTTTTTQVYTPPVIEDTTTTTVDTIAPPMESIMSTQYVCDMPRSTSMEYAVWTSLLNVRYQHLIGYNTYIDTSEAVYYDNIVIEYMLPMDDRYDIYAKSVDYLSALLGKEITLYVGAYTGDRAGIAVIPFRMQNDADGIEGNVAAWAGEDRSSYDTSVEDSMIERTDGLTVIRHLEIVMSNYFWEIGSYDKRDYGYWEQNSSTFLHEFGHILGLRHTHLSDPTDEHSEWVPEEEASNSVMSYYHSVGDAYLDGDIAGLQYILCDGGFVAKDKDMEN